MHPLDYAVVSTYLLATVGLGIAFGRQKSREEFFLAGRSMGMLPVGLSVMATLFSSNSFVMYPGVAFGDSLKIGLSMVAFTLMAPVVIGVFIPVYARCGCQTAYEYLEQRFHVSVRCLASGLFILLRIGWMASATFSATLVLASVSGIDQIVLIFALGVVSVAYTMLGGLRAVMWTDVIQFFVFAVTIVLALGLIFSMQPEGASGVFTTYFDGRPDMLFDFTPSLALEYGSWAILIGVFLEAVSAFGADQVAVQRYISARDERTSQRAFLLNLAGMWLVVPSLLVIGVGLYAHYQHHPDELQEFASADEEITPELAASSAYRDRAMPTFVRTHFPPGMTGLFLAALMAAVMSSIDSGIHSVTTAITVDFRDRLWPHLKPNDEQDDVRFVRLLVCLIGALSVILACFVGTWGDVFTIGKKTTSAFGGPLLAVFVLALFSPRSKTLGVFAGTLVAAAITLVLMTNFDWFAVWFWPIGFGLSIVLSLILNLVLPKVASDAKTPLTFAEIRRRRPSLSPDSGSSETDRLL